MGQAGLAIVAGTAGRAEGRGREQLLVVAVFAPERLGEPVLAGLVALQAVLPRQHP